MIKWIQHKNIIKRYFVAEQMLILTLHIAQQNLETSAHSAKAGIRKSELCSAGGECSRENTFWLPPFYHPTKMAKGLIESIRVSTPFCLLFLSITLRLLGHGNYQDMVISGQSLDKKLFSCELMGWSLPPTQIPCSGLERGAS